MLDDYRDHQLAQGKITENDTGGRYIAIFPVPDYTPGASDASNQDVVSLMSTQTIAESIRADDDSTIMSTVSTISTYGSENESHTTELNTTISELDSSDEDASDLDSTVRDSDASLSIRLRIQASSHANSPMLSVHEPVQSQTVALQVDNRQTARLSIQ